MASSTCECELVVCECAAAGVSPGGALLPLTSSLDGSSVVGAGTAPLKEPGASGVAAALASAVWVQTSALGPSGRAFGHKVSLAVEESAPGSSTALGGMRDAHCASLATVLRIVASPKAVKSSLDTRRCALRGTVHATCSGMRALLSHTLARPSGRAPLVPRVGGVSGVECPREPGPCQQLPAPQVASLKSGSCSAASTRHALSPSPMANCAPLRDARERGTRGARTRARRTGAHDAPEGAQLNPVHMSRALACAQCSRGMLCAGSSAP